jgi:hypothetical protein
LGLLPLGGDGHRAHRADRAPAHGAAMTAGGICDLSVTPAKRPRPKAQRYQQVPSQDPLISNQEAGPAAAARLREPAPDPRGRRARDPGGGYEVGSAAAGAAAHVSNFSSRSGFIEFF